MSKIDEMKAALEKGVEMRTAQKEYFKLRGREALARSKALEKDFDKLAAAALTTDLLG